MKWYNKVGYGSGDFIQNTFKDNLVNTAEIITMPEADVNGKSGCSTLRTDDYNRVYSEMRMGIENC